jgi:uncharacterized membrane protein
MFELLFKYPASLFHRSQFVLLAPWPLWGLGVAIIAAAALLWWHVRRHHGLLTGARPAAIWLLETALIALVLFLLWHPALSVATLKQQQNVIAVLVDDSRSMSIAESGGTRAEQVKALLSGGLLDDLGKKFQVRMYRFGKEAERIQKTEGLKAAGEATRIGDSLKQVLAESSSLPLGAVVLLSDGADNSGGIDLETIQQIRRQRIPVHTVGFGREKYDRDLEINDVSLPARALADSRLNAQVTFRQNGLSGQRARLTVRDGSQVLATQEITLKAEGAPQTENVMFNAGGAGPKNLQIAIDPLPGEQNKDNNSVMRLVSVDGTPRRVLYFEGEPRWEYGFLRRALADEKGIQLYSMVRTTPNKLLTQPPQGADKDKATLEKGFPATAEELFTYSGLILGSNEVNYFTPAQQELIKEFANRRGGGILFMGGRFALGEAGWPNSPLAELIPARLPDHRDTFHRDQTAVKLTAQGRESVITRLADRPEVNDQKWDTIPLLANYNELGEAKPGAVTLLETKSKRQPLLAAENYGRGRTVVFATCGSWRWKMLTPHEDKTHTTFWQQLARYLVSGTPNQVMSSTPRQVLSDETNVHLRAEVRGTDFKPKANATGEAHLVGPGGLTENIELKPVPLEEGVYAADWTAEKTGSYVAEITAKADNEEVGRDVLTFRREDGVAEHFRSTQNRELLEKLADQTGGRYYKAADARKLAGNISYSEAGITTRETKDLWDMPMVFLLALMLRGSEWLLRRRWGVV